MPTIELKDVSKKFGSIRALDDINIKVDGPGCIGILGPNGAGKTTMLKILTNIARPTSGSAKINGISVSETPAKALSSVGALVEQPEFYPYLTAKEILSFVAKIKKIRGKIDGEIRRVAEMTGITTYMDRKAGEMSRGMKQRLGLAVALIGDPEVLILDEPTFGLDPSGMKSMREIIKSLNARKEKIIMLSTHLIYEAQEVCDRILIINKGNVGYDTTNGSPDQIRIELENNLNGVKFPEDLVKEYSTSDNVVFVKKRDGVSNSDIIAFCHEMGLRIRWITPYNDIENVYVKLTKSWQ